MSLPGHFHDEAYVQVTVFVGSADCIHYIQALTTEPICDQALKVPPDFLADWFVIVLALIGPPNGVAGRVVTHQILVFRRSAGKYAGVYRHSTRFCQFTALEAFQSEAHFLFVEELITGVIDDFAGINNSVLCQVWSRASGLQISEFELGHRDKPLVEEPELDDYQFKPNHCNLSFLFTLDPIEQGYQCSCSYEPHRKTEAQLFYRQYHTFLF